MIIVTRYDDKYAPYRPFWEFCIDKAYPEYSHHTEESKHPAIDRLMIDPYPSHINSELITVYHDYHYITDIDMMILPEDVSIKDFHVQEMIKECLCYSNTPRNNTEVQSYNRMTGLHFVSLDWFKETKAARDKYKDAINRGIFNQRIDDELLLKVIIEESGLPIAKKKPLIKRHHGIHFGTLRNYMHRGWPMTRENLRLRVSPDFARKYQELISCSEWVSMVEAAPEWLKEEMKVMDRFTKTRQKQ